MEKILKFVVRHLVFVLASMVALFIVALTFGGNPNYLSWTNNEQFLLGFLANVTAIVVHVWFYVLKGELK